MNNVEGVAVDVETCDVAGGPTDSTSQNHKTGDRLGTAHRGEAGPSEPGLLARDVLLGAYRPGDDWDDMFDRLTEVDLDRLMALFPFMPAQAARHFAERFVIPARN